MADTLRNGIHELRARSGRVNYRLLYFFHGRMVAILAHSLTKEAAVPDADIDRAVARKRVFEDDPETHTAENEIS
jgi:phage-related protein